MTVTVSVNGIDYLSIRTPDDGGTNLDNATQQGGDALVTALNGASFVIAGASAQGAQFIDASSYLAPVLRTIALSLPSDVVAPRVTVTIKPNNGTVATDNVLFDNFKVTSGFRAVDTDGDSVANHLDLDADNDGISDLYESNGGGAKFAADANQDGTVSLTEGSGDADNDGLMDIFDANIANRTGTASKGTTPIDTDGDATADYRDLDSDADGIADAIEARLTAGYTTVVTTDGDGDGVAQTFDPSNAAGGAFGGKLPAPVDTDGDGKADYIDLDADNDGKTDAAEKGTGTTPSYAIPDGLTGSQTLATVLANEVGDTSELAWREVNLPPVAVDETITVAEDNNTVTFNLLANDTDPNAGDVLSFKTINGQAVSANAVILSLIHI